MMKTTHDRMALAWLRADDALGIVRPIGEPAGIILLTFTSHLCSRPVRRRVAAKMRRLYRLKDRHDRELPVEYWLHRAWACTRPAELGEKQDSVRKAHAAGNLRELRGWA